MMMKMMKSFGQDEDHHSSRHGCNGYPAIGGGGPIAGRSTPAGDFTVSMRFISISLFKRFWIRYAYAKYASASLRLPSTSLASASRRAPWTETKAASASSRERGLVAAASLLHGELRLHRSPLLRQHRGLRVALLDTRPQ